MKMIYKDIWFSLYGIILISTLMSVIPVTVLAEDFSETLAETMMEEIETMINEDMKYRSNNKPAPQNLCEDFQCPPPFFQIMNECFYVHVQHHLTWWEARDFCNDMGGDLAEPLHLGALIAVVSKEYHKGPRHFWLGASDLKQEGNFTWLSDAPVTSGWRRGQPDDNGGKEDCVELWPSKYPSLGDKNCYHFCAFICQYQ